MSVSATASDVSEVPSTRNKWGEFFSLKGLALQAGRIPEPVKKAALQDLRVAKQKREAAETLWRTGFTAEALRLALDGFRAALQACNRVRDASFGEAAKTEDMLRALGLRASKVRDMVRTESIAQNEELPLFEDEIQSAQEEDLKLLLQGTEQLESTCGALCLSPRQITMQRAKRASLTAIATIAILGIAIWSMIPKRSIEAEATSYWGNVSDFAPANVLDGIESTEWLTPDGTAATLTLRLMPPRQVRGIRMLNSHNHQFNDRATKDFTVELLSQGRVVRTIKSVFSEFQEVPVWRTIEAPGSDIDMIRIGVLTWHRTGGGIAEVGIIENESK